VLDGGLVLLAYEKISTCWFKVNSDYGFLIYFAPSLNAKLSMCFTPLSFRNFSKMISLTLSAVIHPSVNSITKCLLNMDLLHCQKL
jgi:hypothetical protein